MISATTQSLAINLTAGPRARAAEAGPRNAAADAVLRRRPGRQLPGGLGADGGPGLGDRQARLRRLAPGGDHPGGAGDPGGRRVLLLLPRLRPDRGRSPPRTPPPAVSNATVLPLYFISGVFIPDSEIPSGVLQRRRRLPDPPLLRGLLRGLGPEHHRRRLRARATWRSSPPGASSGSSSPCASSAGSRGADGLPINVGAKLTLWPGARPRSAGRRRERIDRTSCSTTRASTSADLERSGAFYDSILAPLGWRRQEDGAEVISWGMIKLRVLHHARGLAAPRLRADLLPGEEHPGGEGVVRVGGEERRRGGIASRAARPASAAATTRPGSTTPMATWWRSASRTIE